MSDQCRFDGRPIVELPGPIEVELGQRVTVDAHVDLAPGREIDTVSWTLGSELVGDEQTLELVVVDPQAGHLIVSVTDDSGASGSASTELYVCSALAGPCRSDIADAGCCDPNHECRDDDNDGEGACAAPPT